MSFLINNSRLHHDLIAFLSQCDPRAKLVAFFLMMMGFMTQQIWSWTWLINATLVISTGILTGNRLNEIFIILWRLRWLLIFLVGVHGLFTPGQTWGWFSEEGLWAGTIQALRMIQLALLAWILARTTTSWQWLGAFQGNKKNPVQQWLMLLGYSLECLARLVKLASQIRMQMDHRLGTPRSFRDRLHRLPKAGQALLNHLAWEIRRQENLLICRGYATSLPGHIQLADSIWQQRNAWLLILSGLGWGISWLA